MPDSLISAQLAAVKEPANGPSSSVIYSSFVDRINEEKTNFAFLYLVISSFDRWDFSLIAAFNREKTSNFRFPNNDTHTCTRALMFACMWVG